MAETPIISKGKIMQMKQLSRLFFLFLFACYSMLTFAAHRQNDVYLSVMGGYYDFGDAARTKNGFFPSMSLGYDITQQVGVEFFGGYMNTERTRPSQANGSTDTTLALYLLNGVYHFRKDSLLQPYVTGGLGVISLTNNDYDASQNPAADIGGGIEYFLSPHIALKGDMRLINTFYLSRVDVLSSVGISVLF
jgi:outer membrane protein W